MCLGPSPLFLQATVYTFHVSQPFAAITDLGTKDIVNKFTGDNVLSYILLTQNK